MKYIEPGPKLDALVRAKIDGEEGNRSWTPSTCHFDIHYLIRRISPYVGKYEASDGFFTVTYAEFADHGKEDKKRWCNPDWKWYVADDDDSVDLLPWSCHFHLGGIGADSGCPKHWKHGDAFCARGRTMAHAVCLAFLKSMEKAKKPLGLWRHEVDPMLKKLGLRRLKP